MYQTICVAHQKKSAKGWTLFPYLHSWHNYIRHCNALYFKLSFLTKPASNVWLLQYLQLFCFAKNPHRKWYSYQKSEGFFFIQNISTFMSSTLTWLKWFESKYTKYNYENSLYSNHFTNTSMHLITSINTYNANYENDALYSIIFPLIMIKFQAKIQEKHTNYNVSTKKDKQSRDLIKKGKSLNFWFPLVKDGNQTLQHSYCSH